MNERMSKSKGQNYIRVCLQSGTSFDPLGDEEIAIFCKCDCPEPSVKDVDTKGLIQWVNSSKGCKKNQSNDNYRLSNDIDAISVIFLSAREIESCQKANRIYPSEC